MKNSALAATAGGFGAILLWSTTVAVTRSLAEQVGPITAATAIHVVCGAAALAALVRGGERRREIFRLPAKYLLGCGTLFVAYLVLFYLAVGWAANRQQVLEAGLLNYLWPVLTLLLSLAFLGKKANWVIVPGTLLALAGVFLVVTQGSQVSWRSLVGNVGGNPGVYGAAIAAAGCWAMYSVLTRKWAGGCKQGAVALFLPITAAVLLLTCCLLDEPRQWSLRAGAEALFMGASTYVAYALWDNAMRHGNVVMVAAASYLTPLGSTIVSCLYLAVVPSSGLWVGCGLLILGSILSWQAVGNDSAAEEIAGEAEIVV